MGKVLVARFVYFDEEKEPAIKGVDQELMASLDRARHKAGIPFIVTSGYRTDEDNFSAGGVSDSAHTKGLAVDLRCKDSKTCFMLVKSLMDEGFKRFVIGLRFEKNEFGKDVLSFHNLHVDTDQDKPLPVLAIKLYG